MSEQTGTALAGGGQAEVAAIRQAGGLEVARRGEVARLFRMLEGMEWGSGTQVVKGSSFSPTTRQAFAEFCYAARANPMYHVDVLGGKPFLNAKYWSDRINTEPNFVDFALANISDDAAKRAEWGVPEWATQAYECTIRKLANFAPVAKIRSGEVSDWERYLVAVSECNWAGNKPKGRTRDGKEYEADPIGNAEPAKTARTRALRRCAATAFPAWMAAEEARIQKLESAVEAEFSVLRTERAADADSLPRPGAAQALRVGAGEPSAARAPSEAEPVSVVEVSAASVVVPAESGQVRNSRLRFAEGCRVQGLNEREVIDAVLGLGVVPETLEDFRALNGAVERHGDGLPLVEAGDDALGLGL
jgi:hypothetical protein